VSEIVGAFDQRDPSQRTRFSQVCRISKRSPGCFFRRQCGLSPLGYEPAFFLGQSRVKMQHEWIGIPTELCDNERHALGHQASDKRHVARKAVELGNNYATLRSLCGGQGGR